MKLWEKGYKIDELVESFTIGKDRFLDIYLAEYDVIGSKAHANMLESIEMLSPDENRSIQLVLDRILDEIKKGSFYIDDGVEDVHSQVELILTRELGETGKKIHLGRSRNDQILLDLRLFFRDHLGKLAEIAASLVTELIRLADEHKEVLMPGYTHTQVAMVSSFGLWFTAFAEALVDDIEYCLKTRACINRSPLGTAAGYGSSIGLNRHMTSKELAFDGLCINPINAQIGRGKTEWQVANALASFGLTINKLASDICLFSNENYGFFSLPEHYTTGSSIMPHKKNPDVFELIRAKSNLLIQLPSQISASINNLQTGYHRDFQLLKELILPSIFSCIELLSLLVNGIPKLEISPTVIYEDKYKYLFSVEAVNDYVKEGMPFRSAYQKVIEDITNDQFTPRKSVSHSHLGSIGNLGLEEISERLEDLLNN